MLDFGLAKAIEHDDGQVTVSQEGEVAGTPVYMSPEQAAGTIKQISVRSDVYSLGAVLFHLLTGQYPHDITGGSAATLRRVVALDVRRPRELNPRIDPEVELILLKALAHESRDRYASAGELAADIENYLRGDPVTARRRTTAYVLAKRIRQHWVRLAVGSAFVCLLAIVGCLAWAYLGATRDHKPIADRGLVNSNASIQATSAPSPPTATRTKPPPSSKTGPGEWIDALSMVLPRKDCNEYWFNYVWRPDGLTDQNRAASLPWLPVIAEGDYEIRTDLEWSPLGGDGFFRLYLPVGQSVGYMMLSHGRSSMAVPGGSTNAASTAPFKLGQPNQLLVSVKVDGNIGHIVSQLDGQPFVCWDGPWPSLADRLAQMGLRPGFRKESPLIIRRFDIRSTGGKITPVRPIELMVSGQGNLADRIDLSSTEIEMAMCSSRYSTDQMLTQARDHLILKRLTESKSVGIRATLGNLKFAGPSRVTWRVEMDGDCRISLGPGWGQEMEGNRDALPDSFNGIALARSKEPKFFPEQYDMAAEFKKVGCVVTIAAADQLAGAADANGVYTVCFEQRPDCRQNTWVNSIKVMAVKLTDELVKLASHIPMALRLGIPQESKAKQVKVTLQELMIGPDTPEYRPPAASQPGGTGLD